MNRQEYMTGPSSFEKHREYFSQFVDAGARALVRDLVKAWQADGYKLENDEYLNKIPLVNWDRRVKFLSSGTATKLKEQGDFMSLGTGVCILKEAARQVIEGK